MTEEHTTFVGYADRMRARFFPELATAPSRGSAAQAKDWSRAVQNRGLTSSSHRPHVFYPVEPVNAPPLRLEVRTLGDEGSSWLWGVPLFQRTCDHDTPSRKAASMTHSHPFDRPTASPIVLASRSPSRRLALDVLRLDYEVDWSTPRTLLESEIRAYMDTHPVLHCAGAYEEDAALRFAERVEGNPNFRTALPVDRLMLFLREQGVDV